MYPGYDCTHFEAWYFVARCEHRQIDRCVRTTQRNTGDPHKPAHKLSSMQNVAVTPRVTPTVMVQQNIRAAFAMNDVRCQSGHVMDSGNVSRPGYTHAVSITQVRQLQPDRWILVDTTTALLSPPASCKSSLEVICISRVHQADMTVTMTADQ